MICETVKLRYDTGVMRSIVTLLMIVSCLGGMLLGQEKTDALPVGIGVPSLDELAGTWQRASDLASLPAINSTQGSAQCLRDMLSVGNLSFPPITMTGGTGSLRIDGKQPALQQTRWYAYGALRKGTDGRLAIETTVRMVHDQKGLLFRILIRNGAAKARTFSLSIDLTAYTSKHSHWGWKIPRNPNTAQFPAEIVDDGQSLIIREPSEQLANCFSFRRKPDGISVHQSSGRAIFRMTLRPAQAETINFVLAFGEKEGDVHNLAWEWANHFDDTFARVKNVWTKTYADMFTEGNPKFSGYLPILSTPDKALRRMYYMSAVSLLSVYRTCFPIAPRVFVSNSPESNCTMMYFWDTREWATTLALLDPAMLKEYLRSWLSKGIYNGYAEEYLTGTLQGPWYSANDLSIFILLNDYLNVTADTAFLSESISGKTVLQHMDSIATHWKDLVKPGRTLADYGGASNLLECIPTYINEVASFNAANVWMMRRVAAMYTASGNDARSAELTGEANRLLPAVLALYVPGQGVWDALHEDGKKVQVRHVFDFATIGLTIPENLTPAMRNQMTGFVERELMTDHWMRAQSLSDIAAAYSDRPDHGPMGAYCAWPAETMAALCEFDEFGKALDFLHRCTATTYEGPFSQSRELLGKGRDARVRINERGNGGLPTQTYNASNGGSFAETIIRGFFGYQPDFLRKTVVPDVRARGFRGELTNVKQGNRLYDIRSTVQGIGVHEIK
jgi:hypothetical protein